MKDLYIFLSEKKWHKELFENLEKKFQEDSWIWICSKDDFTFENIRKINPKKIFIPHW